MSIRLLFSEHLEHDVADELRRASEYFEFVAERINYSAIRVDVDRELLAYFEPTCLLIQDRSRHLPDVIRAQVDQILSGSNLARTFAILASLSERDLERIGLQRTFLLAVPNLLMSILGFREAVHLARDDQALLTRHALLEAKVALRRIAQIVRYGANLELRDYDDDLSGLKDHYDPSLIQRSKLLAFVNILKVQVGHLPDKDIAKRITERVEHLEAELNKSRPRWRQVIATAFVLFSFIADLKSIYPDTYESVYKTIGALVTALHEDGSVEHQRKPPSLPMPPTERGPDALPPSRPMVQSDDDERLRK